MAGREINIPFGPDRTGGFDLSSMIPEVEPSEPVDELDADLLDVDPVDASSDQGLPSRQADDLADVFADGFDDGQEVADDAETAEEGEGSSAIADVQASLVALKDSIDQGRELKAREKEREEFGQKLEIDRTELADREDILANYLVLAGEQDDIIIDSTQQRDDLKAELSRVTAQQEETSEALQRMCDYHDSQLEPLEAALGRAKAAAEQAKNDERSRKSELNAAETEKRKAEGGDESAMAVAKLEVVQQAFDEAAARSEAARESLAQVQQQYDDLKEQIAQAEAPLERSIEDLSAQADELKEKIANLGETISAARKRRQYCDNVYQYPEETAKLRASVEADEDTARRMDEENDELRDRLADSKQRSKMAKFGIIGVVALIIIILILVFVVGGK